MTARLSNAWLGISGCYMVGKAVLFESLATRPDRHFVKATNIRDGMQVVALSNVV